jgi:aldehyde dehydrogenase (NAD+)
MAPRRVETPLTLIGSRSWIHFEPKGTVLIIAPWNFPVNLTFGPLVSAIAAGNCAILKPSEQTPHASAIMKKIVQKTFAENEVALFEGGREIAEELLKLPFNHIYFTGSPRVGKIVMKAASRHLASLTLELGGKSPTIVDDTADLESAAKRVAWSKYLNNGQICLSPDYLFVHESKLDTFVALMKKYIHKFYGEQADQSHSYARMVNKQHFNRIKGYLDQAKNQGAKIEVGGQHKHDSDYIEPTIVTEVDFESDLMKEEIFGPVLPIFSFASLDQPVKLINEKEIPLALYIYSRSRKNINYILKNTRAGGTCINNSVVHYFNQHLPFGGSNNSGIGKGHGKFGFEAFSNARGIYKQRFAGPVELFMPPYSSFKQKLIDLTIKWF